MSRELVLTLQSDMCGPDLGAVLDLHDAHDLRHLDAKTGLHGEPVEHLEGSEARMFAARVRERGMTVYALSTSLFDVPADDEEALDRAAHRLRAFLAVVEVIAPRYVRVLAPRRPSTASARAASALARAAEDLRPTGARLLVENGPEASTVSSPEAAMRLFHAVSESTDRMHLIWDVQNAWSCGWFPRAEDLDALAPAVRYLHVKGGTTVGEAEGPLVHASTLAEASWPVAEVLDAALLVRGLEAIALNPPHGATAAHRPADAIRDADIEYLLARLRAGAGAERGVGG